MRLNNKIAVVTGGAGGIGRAICQGFAHEGAVVIVVDVNETGADDVSKMIRSEGGNSIPVYADISIEAEVKKIFDVVMTNYGTVDILVNNAAITEKVPFEDCTVEQWDKIFGSNLRGTMFCTKTACQIMKEHKYGKIINVSSMMAFRGQAGFEAYSASKGALFAFTKNVAYQYSQYEITVNNLAPGTVDTDSIESLNDDLVHRQFVIDNIPMHRIASVNEMIGPALFLATDDSSYMTGETILVDGGRSIFMPGTEGVVRVKDMKKV